MIQPSALRSVSDQASLLDFLRNELNWPIRSGNQLYDFYADELGLDEVASGRVGRVMQLASFEKGQPWGIFLVKFDGSKVYRSALRQVLRGLSTTRKNRDAGMPAWQAPHLIFICTADYHSFTFAHYAGPSHTKSRLSVFGWSRDDASVRTLCEFNLSALQYPTTYLDSNAWIRKWEKAWDVEAATQRFYKDFKDVFDQAESQISGVTGGMEEKRLFTQGFFNRLLFIHFLSRKGWLRYEGNTDYLRALWQGRNRQENFYQHHLLPLFFTALCHPQARSLSTVSPSVYKRIGDVPYLNGGLFEPSLLDAKGEIVPDSVIAEIIALFGRYNFTVEESTPLDVQVAVDPEMLGKVFEELVNGRHESGSYYTPRGIVSFMCREAIKGYLGGHEALVDHKDPSGISVPAAKGLLSKLADIKVVDPACGSGAYLLGMMQELNELTALLDTQVERDSVRDSYKRKLHIVQNNVYGVDLDPFAVNIARLRLWLSLAVDFEGDDPEPLPNLDFKVECGDSLAAPTPQGGLQPDMFRQQQIADLEKLKAEYANPYTNEDKDLLRKRIEGDKLEIAKWVHRGKSVTGFDWRVEFAEVFQGRNPGFDAVVMNPPYVRHELIKDQKPNLSTVYPEVYAGAADLYCYFYGRAVQLLRTGGMLAAITPNKWFRAGYGTNLRKHLATACQVLSITDFGELPVFQSAATFPMVFVSTKLSGVTSTPLFTQVKSLNPPYPDVLALQRSGSRLIEGSLAGSDWQLVGEGVAHKLRQMNKAGVTLSKYVNGHIHYGIKTGYNAAFVINGATRARLITEDVRSSDLIKPLAVGDDIRRWHVRDKDRWLICVQRGCPIDRYPAIRRHLQQFQEALEPKPRDWPSGKPWPGRASGIYAWYEMQTEVAYIDKFVRPKILFPVIAKEPRFTFDTSGTYANDKAYMIAMADLYLLGVLNSTSAWEYLKSVCSVLGDADKGGRLELRSIHVKNLPIPLASASEKAAIEALVQKCLDAKGEGCEAWENEINDRVAALYGL